MSSALQRARAGDELAFAELIGPHRRELHLHCYRMLGSLTDADDLLQETMIAAWRGLGGLASPRALRAWLYRIATNRCLNAIRAGRRRPPEVPVPPFAPPGPSRLGDVTWLQPYPDSWLDPRPGPAARYQARESIRLAFITALQRLPPRQAAALILCDALGFGVAEAAAALDTSPAAAKGLLQRARSGLPAPGQAAASPAGAGPGEVTALAARFADAYAADDVAAVVALLTDDAWLAMPPAAHEYHGRAAIAGFLAASAAGRAAAGLRLRLRPAGANRQPAFTCFLAGPRGEEASGVVVLEPAGRPGALAGVTRFLDPKLPALFGRGPGDRAVTAVTAGPRR